MADPAGRRAYHSPQRSQQAAGTRRSIVRAAHGLFTTRGYADTTVADIAAAAGVSVDTLYASVGRKPQLLLAAVEMVLSGSPDPMPVEDRGFVRDLRAASGARAKLASYAAALGRMLPTLAPLSEALRVAGQTDPECRAAWEGLNQRRAGNMLRLAAELRGTGELRPDLSDADVAHLLWALNSAEFYGLATSGGRTPAQFAATVLDVWTRTLLA